MDETASKIDAGTPPDPRVETAKKLRDAWCVMHQCGPEEIPARAEQEATRQSVAVLIYAVRWVVGLELFPAAELLGIEPGRLVLLSRDIRPILEGRKILAPVQEFNKLLVAVRLRKQLKRRIRRPKGTPPGSYGGKRQNAGRKKPADEDKLTAQRVETARKVCEIAGVSFERAFVEHRDAHGEVMARSLVYALLLVLEQTKNAASVARSFGISGANIAHCLRRIDKILRSSDDRHTSWKPRIANACRTFGLKPEQLLLP